MRQGTTLVGLRKPEELIVIVLTLLAYGCPVQAIVHALEVDERTGARWQERAGRHCQKLHEDQVMAGLLDLQHVQADEIRGKGWKMIPWIGLAMMVSTRLWLGGVMSLRRDRPSGRCAAPDGQKLLSTTDCGFGADRRLGRDRDWDGDQKDGEKARR